MWITSRFLVIAGLLPFLLLMSSAHAQGQRDRYDDPPGRVAYISDSEGGISFSPAGEDAWLDLTRNRPLSRGDRLWAGRNARVELQIGSAMARLGGETSFEILELDDRIAQLMITEGVLSLTVQRLQRDEYYEITTPNLAFSIERAGRYRIDVDPRRDETTIVVWEGAGEAYGDGATFPLGAGDTVRFYGYDLRDYQVFGLPRGDRFDQYALERDRRLARSPSLRHVGYDVIGYASLDAYGSWRAVSGHGSVWFPTRVERDWAPYRDGHWVWRDPWGWTWIDHAPWGFAPSHYGRWVHVSNRWGWVPGPRNVRPVYAPALVAFVGGSNWSLSVSLGGRSPIGWFPLGPRDVYVPSYRASRDYFTRVNVNNTVINNTTIINNTYNNYSRGTINVSQVNYTNQSVSGAVTAVPSDVFVNSQSVRQQALRLDSRSLVNAETLRIAQVAPGQRSVLGTAAVAQTKPGREVFDRRVVARTPPPPAAQPIAARAEQLRKQPGVPVQPAASQGTVRESRPQANVRVIPESQGAVNARQMDSRIGGPRVDAAPAQRRQLDREQEARKPAPAAVAEREAVRQPAAAEQQRQRDAADLQRRQQQADAEQLQRQQTEERGRQESAREQQSAREREAAGQRQREADVRQQREQAAESQRQSEAREQQSAREREAAGQRQREADVRQQREQAAESQRQNEAREQQSAREREAAGQRQREADVRQQREQAAESQRQSEAREQQSAREREAAGQRQREADVRQQREQAAESQRQSEAREQQSARQREATEQRQREMTEQESQRRAAEARSGRAPATPVETRKPAPRKDPRTGKDVVEENEDEEDERGDKEKGKDGKGKRDERR